MRVDDAIAGVLSELDADFTLKEQKNEGYPWCCNKPDWFNVTDT